MGSNELERPYRTENSLPLHDQYDNQLPDKAGLIDGQLELQFGLSGEPVGFNEELSLGGLALWQAAEDLADDMLYPSEEVEVVTKNYYRGLLFGIKAASYLKLTEADPLTAVLSVYKEATATGDEIRPGVEYVVDEYKAERPNIERFAAKYERRMRLGSVCLNHLHRASILGFLLTERADGAKWLAEQGLEAGPA